MGGIIFGAMGGLGDAMQSIGKSDQDLQNSQALAQTRGDIDFNNQARLTQMQNDLAIQKEQAILTAKQNAVYSDQARNAGIIGSARQSAVDKSLADMHAMDDPLGPNPPEQQYQAVASRAGNTAAIQALNNAGNFGAAEELAKALSTGATNVPYGSVHNDVNGNVIYDNASDVKADNEERRTAAKEAAAAAKNMPKQIDQKTLDAVDLQVNKLTANATASPNPFATPGDPTTNTDASKQQLYQSVAGKIVMNSMKTGSTVSVPDVVSSIKPYINKYDEQATTEAKTLAGLYFDPKTKSVKDDNAREFLSKNYPDAVTTDYNSFARFVRDKKMQDEGAFNNFLMAERTGKAPLQAAQQNGAASKSNAEVPQTVGASFSQDDHFDAELNKRLPFFGTMNALKDIAANDPSQDMRNAARRKLGQMQLSGNQFANEANKLDRQTTPSKVNTVYGAFEL
jgi:hypothetical protein